MTQGYHFHLLFKVKIRVKLFSSASFALLRPLRPFNKTFYYPTILLSSTNYFTFINFFYQKTTFLICTLSHFSGKWYQKCVLAGLQSAWLSATKTEKLKAFNKINLFFFFFLFLMLKKKKLRVMPKRVHFSHFQGFNQWAPFRKLVANLGVVYLIIKRMIFKKYRDNTSILIYLKTCSCVCTVVPESKLISTCLKYSINIFIVTS